MRITAITPSPEPCVEAGWHASQYYLECPVDIGLVTALRSLGTLLLLDKVRQPFFKVESHHYIIKGLLGDDSIRVAVHRDHTDETQRIIQIINNHE